ncbi:MAG: hypothetical protein U0031_01245 [Thermomicrobiales bacterium]
MTESMACTLSEQELAQRSQEVGRGLFSCADRVEELPDGYRWTFPGAGAWQAQLLEFISAERRCCGFFDIALTFAPNLGPLTLTLRGPDGTKPFIARTFLAR